MGAGIGRLAACCVTGLPFHMVLVGAVFIVRGLDEPNEGTHDGRPNGRRWLARRGHCVGL